MSKRGASPYDFIEDVLYKRQRTNLSIDELYEAITVDPEDKKISRELVDETLAKIVGHIRNNQFNGKLYDHRIVKAGSYAVNAKIGKADEFDMNIPLNIGSSFFRTDTGIYYTYVDSQNSNMKQKLPLSSTSYQQPIPVGYAIVVLEEGQDIDFRVFKHFLHNSRQINVSRHGRTELIPRDIKQDFHSKITEAIRALNLRGVKLDSNAHGPALTLTLSRGEDVDHKIDVDLTLSLKVSLKIEKFEWPRQATKKAFSKQQIENVLEAGIHLVPKKNLFWSISFSRAERALLSGIDADNACRKMTLKILKYLMEKCKLKSPTKLQGMSSHILKTQVLWSCERHAYEENYWNRRNREACLVNTMKELVSSLRAGSLFDYFNCSIDVLGGKNRIVLNELADFMSQTLVEMRQY